MSAIDPLRQQVAQWRQQGERIALVPTMGNLHAGHLALVEQARQLAPKVIASLFVNPTQFGPHEDFSAYPRTLAADQAKLATAGCDLLFAPSLTSVYPQGAEHTTRVEVPGLSDILCGACRPGHFAGVAQVVCKLFNMVQPDIAVFGEKDRQQLLVIQRMVADLNMPITVVGSPTVREADGLAMSSRNAYLDTEQRRLAPQLYHTLCTVKAKLISGEPDYPAMEHTAVQQLAAMGFRPDYVRIVRAQDYADPTPSDTALVIVAAAWLGRARLIDNIAITMPLRG